MVISWHLFEEGTSPLSFGNLPSRIENFWPDLNALLQSVTYNPDVVTLREEGH